MKRRVEMKVLPDGRACIHFLVHDPAGPITTPATAQVWGPIGLVRIGGVRGYIACQPRRTSILPEEVDGLTRLFLHTDDARAVSCPRCLATPEAKAYLAAQKKDNEPAQAG